MTGSIDIKTVHEWLDAGGDPDDLIEWVEMWKNENPDWAEDDIEDSDDRNTFPPMNVGRYDD